MTLSNIPPIFATYYLPITKQKNMTLEQAQKASYLLEEIERLEEKRHRISHNKSVSIGFFDINNQKEMLTGVPSIAEKMNELALNELRTKINELKQELESL